MTDDVRQIISYMFKTWSAALADFEFDYVQRRTLVLNCQFSTCLMEVSVEASKDIFD